MANYEVLEPGGHAALVGGLKDYADREGGTGNNQLASQSVTRDKLGEDVTDELDNKADTDGYYEQLTAGAADNLTGRGDGVDAEYIYRTAGGSADIADGTATVKAIYGHTLGWNQLAKLGENFCGVNTVYATKSYADNTLTATVTVVNGSSYAGAFSILSTDSVGHKLLYLADVNVTSNAPSVNMRALYSSIAATSAFAVQTGKWVRVGSIVTLNSYASATFQFYYDVNLQLSVGDTVKFKNMQVFDLTAMFGAGSEPATVEEFTALYPLPYYAYDAGTLLPVRMTGVETVGFNQWDEQWEAGGISSSGVNANDQNRVRSKNYTSVIDGAVYYLMAPSVNNGYNATVHCYDADFNHFENTVAWLRNSTMTFPSGTKYIRFTFGSSVNPITSLSAGTVCINLSWSGYRNGEYEAYWSQQRAIDVAAYFPDGMRSAGTVRDELTDTEAVTRVGAVDLGTLTWTMVTSGEAPYFSAIMSDIGYSPRQDNFTCAKYDKVPIGSIGTVNGISTTDAPSVRIRDTSYDDAAAFKAAMSGVMLHYALATPTTVTIDPPLNMSYKVSDFGTERVMVPSGSMSAPVPMSIVYGLNAVDFIRRAPTEYISHGSHENFVDALEAEMGITVTESFDETAGEYEYSITPNDDMTLAEAKENLRGLLDLVQGTIGSVTNWSEIVSMASHGSSFLVGTQFQTKYKSAADGTEYDMPWDVVHFETATIRGGGTVSGAYLESHYTLPFATMFDQIEAFYAVPSGGLAAGTYSITFGNTSAWGQVPANSTYHFTLANSYSSGAQLCFNRSIYSYAPDTCTVQAFATQGATTAAETVSVASGASGTSLGTIGTAQVTDASDLNHLHRVGLGSGRWMTSAIRQWLNSDADGGQWWVPQTKWDRPPSYASYDGFLKGVDADLVAAMREIRVVTAQSYSADGGTAASPATDVTYDKVFLPSWEQQYLAVSQSYGGSAGLEGGAWDYWRQAAGTASPRPASGSDTSTYTPAYVRYAMENHTTARYSWLRSAHRSHGYNAAVVYSSGSCGSHSASNGNFAAPACFIG